SNCFSRARSRLDPSRSKPRSGDCWPAGSFCAYRAVMQRPRMTTNCNGRMCMPHSTAVLEETSRGLRKCHFLANLLKRGVEFAPISAREVLCGNSRLCLVAYLFCLFV